MRQNEDERLDFIMKFKLDKNKKHKIDDKFNYKKFILRFIIVDILSIGVGLNIPKVIDNPGMIGYHVKKCLLVKKVLLMF